MKTKDDKQRWVLEQDPNTQDISKYPVAQTRRYNRGTALDYSRTDGTKEVCYVGRKYQAITDGHNVYYGKVAGNNSAAYLPMTSSDQYCPGEDLSRLVRADFGGRLAKAITKGIPWGWIIVIGIGFIVVMGVVIFLVMKARGGA